MYDIDYEFKKGYFFIRIIGNININNYMQIKKELKYMIEDLGFTNIVLDTNKIDSIEVLCINSIKKIIYKKICDGINIILYNSSNNISRIFCELMPNIKKENEIIH